MNLILRCVTLLFLLLLTLVAIQVTSVSYHHASFGIVVGFAPGDFEWFRGQLPFAVDVEYRETDSFTAPQANTAALPAPFTTPRANTVPKANTAPQAQTAPQAKTTPQASAASQTQAAPQAEAAPQAHTAPKVPLPNNACVRKRLAEAQAQVKDIKTSLEKADSGLRQQMSREQELKRSIVDLENKRAHLTCLY